MKGVEFLRNLYASSGLSIRSKTQLNKIEMMKALAMSLGFDPESPQQGSTEPAKQDGDRST